MTNDTITIKQLYHRDQHCLGLYFNKNATLISLVRKIPGIRFSATHSCWYVPVSSNVIEEIRSVLEKNARLIWTDGTHGTPPTDPEQTTRSMGPAVPAKASDPTRQPAGFPLEEMEKKLDLKGYSRSTISTYISQFRLFLEYLKGRELQSVQEDDIRKYLLVLIRERRLSKSTQNQAINAIKFYFEKIAGQPRRTYYIERPMKERLLPSILSEEEVRRIFEATENIKHKLMLMIIYSGGLRRSELLSLHIGDLDRDRNTIFVRDGKGRKDRTTTLAQRLRPYISRYLEEYKPQYWFFEGVKRSRYSATSLHHVFTRAVAKAGIAKDVSLHSLRHSFATHLLESGASTLYIQKLLGHNSPKTTEIYAQVTKFGMDRIRSPFDGESFGKNDIE